MSKLLKQLLAVALAFQTTLSGISTIVHAEEPEEEPEYMAETVVDEEEETLLTEEGDEENVIVIEQEEEEPEVPEVEEEPGEPEVTEEPEETETPEVTEPEETEEPEITEEPEETEVPEVTEPEETPEVTEEPEETTEPDEPAEESEDLAQIPEELAEFDGSEPFQLKIKPGDYDYDSSVSISTVQYDMTVRDGTYNIQYTASVPLSTYIVAIKDEVFWFLDYNESPSSGTNNRDVKFNIPAGGYRVCVAFYLFGTLYISVDGYNLYVLDAPKVTGTGNFKGSEKGYIDIDISKFNDTSYPFPSGMSNDLSLSLTPDGPKMNLGSLKSYADGNTFRVLLGDSSAYGGAGTFKDYPYGSFDLSYQIDGSNAVDTSSKHIFASSNTTHADIMQDIKPTKIWLSSTKNELYYKGETAQIQYWFDSEYDNPTDPMSRYEGLDRRVTFKSDAPKYLSVDQNGTVKVVSMPKTDLQVMVTVTSVADPSVYAFIYIWINPVVSGKADMKVLFDGQEYSTFNWTIGKQTASSHLAEVVFRIDDPQHHLEYMPVAFNVTGDGMNFLENPDDPAHSDVVNTYYGEIHSGEARAAIRGWNPGTYQVKVATPVGKEGTVTVNVDGVSNNLAGGAQKTSQYFVNGKAVTGWVRYDKLTDSYVLGKDVFKGFTDPANQWISYVDPKTKKVVTGDPWNGLPDTVAKIDGKLYAFNAGNGLVTYWEGGQFAEGWVEIYHETHGEYYVYLNKNAEVQTGWVNTKTDGWVYLDPTYGFLKRNTFVPAQNGKGVTYVDDSGKITTGIFVYQGRGETQPITDEDGLYRIFVKEGSGTSSNYYWVKNGAIQTGWVYLHYNSKTSTFTWNTTAKGALEKMYFDPSENGKLKLGTFTVNGKTYYSDETKYPDFYLNSYDYYRTVQTPGNLYTKYPEKYVIHPLNGTVIDSDGAIVFDKMVKIAVWDGTESKYDKYYVYADGSGQPVKNTWISYNGKKYYFDDSGYLSDTKTGTSWMYHDETDGDRVLYYKLKDPKNPQAGYVYCDTNGKKLTSLMVYNDAGDKVGLLDAKGNWAVNAVVTVKMSQNPSSASGTYIADENGNIIVNHSVDRLYSVAEVKGKKYIVDDNGVVKKDGTEPYHAYSENYGNVWVWPEKNGVLASDTFKTYSTGTNGTFKIYFAKEGAAIQGVPEIYHDFYAWHAKKKTWLAIRTEDDYIGFVIPGKTIYPGLSDTVNTGWVGNSDSPIYLNKDGSIKTGFIKHGNYTKYLEVIDYGYVIPAEGTASDYVDEFRRNALFKIKGKTYFFDEYGNMVTGWVHFEHAIVGSIIDLMAAGLETTDFILLDDVYMYFNDKTGAAVTGSAKVLTPAVYNGEISLGEEGTFENNAKRVNTTSSAKTLYFTSDGALIRDQNTKVGKKLSEVGADGVVTTGTAHWSDADKITYVMKNGALATGRQKIDGKYYYFDPTTGRKVTNALRKTGKKWYYYGDFGEQETPAMGMVSDHAVTLPVYMQDEWDKTFDVMIGSTNGKELTAVWNKDGSLAKIVYTNTNKAAAGESVSFGIWDWSDDDMVRKIISAGLNGYVLDSKGLPMTGIVNNFSFEGDTEYGKYSLSVEKDGKKQIAEDSCYSLVKIGKKYYMMYGGIIVTEQTGIIQLDNWSTLPASDQKSLNEMAWIASRNGLHLFVMMNPDGSVAANTKRYGYLYLGSSIYGNYAEGTWTTNKQGIILDLVAWLYKVGKTTYINNVNKSYIGSGSFTLTMMDMSNLTMESFMENQVEVMVKYNGTKVIGFYNAKTGKPLTGCYYGDFGYAEMLIWLSKGQPQSGNKVLDYLGMTKMKFYVDPNMIGTVPGYYD